MHTQGAPKDQQGAARGRQRGGGWTRSMGAMVVPGEEEDALPIFRPCFKQRDLRYTLLDSPPPPQRDTSKIRPYSE